MKKELTYFIQSELYPAMWDNIPRIFPEMQFTRKGNKWCSRLHNDGTTPTHPAEDKSVITSRVPSNVYDQSRGPKDLLTLYMEFNGLSSTWAAVEQICNIIGLTPPKQDPAAEDMHRKAAARRSALERSLERQKRALFSPAGAEVLAYLRNVRGWTDEEIKTAELGFISTREAAEISAQRSVGEYYTLSIPLRSMGSLYGFKFRTIRKDGTGNKYAYLYGTSKKDNLYNLTALKQRGGRMVVVEGELDALRASVKGVENVVASSGGSLTEELLQRAIDMGITRVVLLFDKDKAGQAFTVKTIQNAYKKKVSVCVATFPEGEVLPNGKPIHDVDEYLTVHTAEELRGLIDAATMGGKYLLYEMINNAVANGKGITVLCEDGVTRNALTDEQQLALRDEVITLAMQIPDEVERGIVYREYAECGADVGITEDAIRCVVDRRRAEENILLQERKTATAVREIAQLQAQGDTAATIAKMEETVATLKEYQGEERFTDLLRVPTRAQRVARFRDVPKALNTSYQFTENGGGVPLRLTLPAGALTMIAAPTSHGKSTLLRNLALDVVGQEEGKSVLYFTFEESEEDVLAQFVNTHINKRLHAVSKEHSQTESIAEYYRTGEAAYIGGSNAEITREEFIRQDAYFHSHYLESGKLRLFYRDYNLEALIEALEFAVKHIPTAAIFIDYIQILRSQKYNKSPRTEQLKEACISLKDFAVKYRVPVILAAQLNREARTPLRMDNSQMAESSDIEKAANTIVCVWNSQFKSQAYGSKGKDEEEDVKELEGKGFTLGKGGKVLIKLTKRRGHRVGLYSILDFEGHTGKIVGNYKPETQSTLDFNDTNNPY